MDIISATYPLSVIALLFGFILGISFSVVVVGSLTFFVIFFMCFIGYIKIFPLFDIIAMCLQYIFPQLKKIETNIHDSFPIYYSDKIIDGQNYIYSFHPHGLFSISYFFHIGTNLTDWKDKNTLGTALNTLWWLPFGREFFERYKFIQSNYKNMKQVLTSNKSLSVILGGVKEMPFSSDNKIITNILKRRGIFKMSLETGIPLVPVIVYGENEIYKMSDNKIFEYINNFTLKYNIYIPIPTLESFTKWLKLFFKPLNKPIKTYVGEPVHVIKNTNPTENDIINLREQYFSNLKQLYSDTRPYNYDKELYII